MSDDRRLTETPTLRVWAVDVTGKPPKGYYGRNNTVTVAAPNIETAIEAAKQECVRQERFESGSAWVVSASHRGPVNVIVGADQENNT